MVDTSHVMHANILIVYTRSDLPVMHGNILIVYISHVWFFFFKLQNFDINRHICFK